MRAVAEKYHRVAQEEVTILFADILGSTRMAERLGTTEFSRLIDRYYQVRSRMLIEADAMIEKLIGDEVTGVFLPGFAGDRHASIAVRTARKLMKATGHSDPQGPWAPLGIGIHTGTAYMGSVGQPGGLTDIAALGAVVNTAARITAQAAPGEILISEETRIRSNLDELGWQQKALGLKDVSTPTTVWSSTSSSASKLG